jgi:hypothetical protein
MFPLRQFVRCSCGRGLTGSWHAGRVRRHAYYNCYNVECDQYNLYVPVADLHTQFVALLSAVAPCAESMETFRQRVRERWQVRHRFAKQQAARVDDRLKTLQAKKERLFEMRLNGELLSTEFAKLKDKIDQDLAACRVMSAGSVDAPQDLDEMLDAAGTFLTQLDVYWQSATAVECKRQLQRLVFPEGVVYDHATGSFGTATLAPIFGLLEPSSGSRNDPNRREGAPLRKRSFGTTKKPRQFKTFEASAASQSAVVAEGGHHWNTILENVKGFAALLQATSANIALSGPTKSL